MFIAEPLKRKPSKESREKEKEREPQNLVAIESAKEMMAAIAKESGVEVVKPKRVKRQYGWEKAKRDGVVVLPIKMILFAFFLEENEYFYEQNLLLYDVLLIVIIQNQWPLWKISWLFRSFSRYYNYSKFDW